MTKHRLDRVASAVWYQAVEIGLGMDSPIAVELHLEGDQVKPDADGIKRPRKWKQYRDGKRTPKDVPGTLNVFEIAECKAPGTARWFRSPLWKALKGSFNDADQLYDLLCDQPAIEPIVFSTDDPLEYDFPAEDDLPVTSGTASFKRFEIDRIQACAELDGVDLLEAVVLVLEYGNLLRQPAITMRGLDLYRAASSKISKIPELRTSLVSFFEAMEDRYASILGVPPEEMFPPWHVRMPHLVEQVFDIDAMKREAIAWDGKH